MWNKPNIATLPPLGAFENQPLLTVPIAMHFFIGGCDWYISEADGKDTMFGFAILNSDFQNAEWGYVSLSELDNISIGGIEVDFDLHWHPKMAGQIDNIVKGMNEIRHTDQCLQQRLDSFIVQDNWIKQWPNQCQYCNGWGGSTFEQSHPYGSTVAVEEMFEPCEHCLAEGRCPRCGLKTLGYSTVKGDVCISCNWTDKDGMPPLWPYDVCACEQFEMEQSWHY